MLKKSILVLSLLSATAVAEQEKLVIEEINDAALSEVRARRIFLQAPNATQQEKPAAPAPQTKEPPDAPSHTKKAKKEKGDRYELVQLNDENWTPLSKYEKFRLFTDDLISPGTHLALAGAAWLSWTTNDQSYMGPGFEGWAKRYGYSVADEAVGQFIGAFALPVIFKQDPRYLPRDKGTKKRRTVYAMTRVLITRNDAGGESFNVSKVGGTFMVSALSNLYYPSGRDSSAGTTLSRAGFSLLTDAGYNIFVEFWPDVAQKVHLGKFFQQLVRRSIQVNRTKF